MSATTIGLVIGAIALSVTGQVLLKSGASQLAGINRLEFLLAAARDIRVLTALAAWLAWVLCWVHVLRVAPLSTAYALTSLTYVLIPIVSAYVFGEPIRRWHVVGIMLIAAGIACVLAND